MTDLEQDSLQKILNDNDHVFGTDGLLRDRAVRISVKDTNPKYCKARVPPYALRGKIEDELNRLRV